jgi:PadR family transcriptional regulator PadR
VLLTIATLGEEAYGVSIQQDIENRCNRNISIGALHSTITRLEEKGFLKSWLGGATQERGGRSKRFYEITQPVKRLWQKAKACAMNCGVFQKLNFCKMKPPQNCAQNF